MFKAKKGHNPDYVFAACVFLLTIFGFLALASASSDLAKMKFNDTYFYIKHQFFYGLIFGIIGFFVAAKIYFQNLRKIAIPFLLINVLLLILIFTPLGFSNKGASRWLQFGFFSFQPAEFLKLSFIIYIAALLSGRKSKFFFPFVAVSGLIGALILSQPATTIFIIIIAAALAMYFISGARLIHILGFVALGLLILIMIIYSSPYRYERIMSYFEKSVASDATTRYQLNQSLIAIGSGGLWGVGFGKSTIKYKYLPEAIGDSIFSVIAEEFGFLGAILLISTFLTLLFRGFIISKKSSDSFGELLSLGMVLIIALQAFVHIAANSGLLPLTGIPLPFISYGGTALAVFLTMAGIVVNISKYT